MPRFGVLVPTRDRPDLLGLCLEGLAAQTFEDIEVVVVDNPVHAPAREVFERWRRPGWRYVAAPQPLNMADNWEFGLGQTNGDFVAVLIDKWVLHPSALELVEQALQEDREADLVSWWSDDYVPADGESEVGQGRFVVTHELRAPARFDPDDELRKMYSLEQRRGLDRIHHHRGKICFGVFSHELVNRILAGCGRVFYPLSPDYTSRVPALSLTRGAIDMGRPLVLAHSHQRSNGNQTAVKPSFAESFVLESDPAALAQLPIPGLYTSLHNLVAYDLVRSASRLPSRTVPDLDRRNLLRRAREDLAGVIWDSPEVREEQYAILETEEARLGVTPVLEEPPEPDVAPNGRPVREAATDLLRRVPPVERVARWVLGRPGTPPPPPPPPPVFESPLAAAFAADRLYTVAHHEVGV